MLREEKTLEEPLVKQDHQEDKPQAATHGAHWVFDSLLLASQMYFLLSFFVAICRVCADALPRPNDDGEFFTEDQLFFYTVVSSLLLAAKPLIDTGLHYAETAIIACRSHSDTEKKKAKAITSLIQEKVARFDSTILASAITIAFLATLATTDDPTELHTKAAVTYEDLDLRAVKYTKIWLLCVLLASASYLVINLILVVEALRHKYTHNSQQADIINTCFAKHLLRTQFQDYQLVSLPNGPNSPLHYQAQAKDSQTVYRHHPIAHAIILTGVTIMVGVLFYVVMGQVICETDLSHLLDIVADNFVSNLGSNNSDSFIFTNTTPNCGPNSANFTGADLWKALAFIDESSRLGVQGNGTLEPLIYLDPSILANISGFPHLPLGHNRSVVLPLNTIPENIARLYGILLALPQEIQAYFGVGIAYITLPIITFLLNKWPNPCGCAKQNQHTFTMIADRYVHGILQSIHHSKTAILVITGVVIFLFKQQDLLPSSQYEVSLWSAAGFYLEHWAKCFSKILLFQDFLQTDLITTGSEQAFQMRLAILAWGTAWTDFLAWVPAVMMVAMLFHGFQAFHSCITGKIPLPIVSMNTRTLFKDEENHQLTNVVANSNNNPGSDSSEGESTMLDPHGDEAVETLPFPTSQ